MVRSDIGLIFTKQKENLQTLKSTTAKQRIIRLKQLQHAILTHRELIKQAAKQDFNKPPQEVDLAEILPVLNEIKHAIKHLKHWTKPCKVGTPLSLLGTSSKVIFEPKGCSLIIAPWNYPFMLSIGPLVSAIASGCSAIIKPSEMTPHLSKLVERLITEVFPPQEAAVVQGAIAETQELLSLPFDHIFFTGSPAVGKIVMAKAAENLTSVTLELGGKSPVIVDESADIDIAVRNISWGKFSNNGQTCIAPDYVYVHESIMEEFCTSFSKHLSKTYGKPDKAEFSPDLARVVNQQHFSRLRRLLDIKADVFYGGVCNEATNFISPTLILEPPLASDLMQEEIFGPLLPILSYNDLNTVLTQINSKPKPLALYIFSQQQTIIEKIIATTSSGGITINNCLLHFIHDELPAGGVNHSGIGKAHGYAGFKAFSNERAVLEDKYSQIYRFFPPYTEQSQSMVNMMLKLLHRNK